MNDTEETFEIPADYTLNDLQEFAVDADLSDYDEVIRLQSTMRALIARGIPETLVLDVYGIARRQAASREFLNADPAVTVWLYSD